MRLKFQLINIINNRPEYKCEQMQGLVKLSLKLFDGLPPDEIWVEAPNFAHDGVRVRSSKERTAAFRESIKELNARIRADKRTSAAKKRAAREETQRCFEVASGRTQDIPRPPAGSAPPMPDTDS